MKHLLCCLLLVCAHNLHAAYASLSTLRSIAPKSAKGSVIPFDEADQLKGFELSPNKEKLIAKEDGVYFMIVTAQYGPMTAGGIGNMDIWFNINGKQVPNSASRGSIERPTDIYPVMTNSIIQLKAGDVIENYFAADAPSIGLLYTKQPDEPGCPSYDLIIFSIE